MNDELEELRKKRLQELQQQAISEEDIQQRQAEQQKNYEEQKKQLLRSILTPKARERLGRIKIARPEVVESIEQQLLILAQQGRLKTKINDEQLQGLLSQVMPKKRDIKIQRR